GGGAAERVGRERGLGSFVNMRQDRAVRPQEEYRRRLESRVRAAKRLEKRHASMGAIRLVLAALALAGGWAVFRMQASSLLLLAPVAGFVGAVMYHGFVRRHLERATRAVTFYENGLARIEDRWSGTGPGGERFAPPHHVYAADLDLF